MDTAASKSEPRRRPDGRPSVRPSLFDAHPLPPFPCALSSQMACKFRNCQRNAPSIHLIETRERERESVGRSRRGEGRGRGKQEREEKEGPSGPRPSVRPSYPHRGQTATGAWGSVMESRPLCNGVAQKQTHRLRVKVRSE